MAEYVWIWSDDQTPKSGSGRRRVRVEHYKKNRRGKKREDWVKLWSKHNEHPDRMPLGEFRALRIEVEET